MTNLKGIWPVMTLFYDYNMLSFVGIFDTEIFDICFSKSSKQVHKIIISKDFIWVSYNIHFVSTIIIIIIFPLIMQQWVWKLQHPLPSPVTTGFWSSSKPKGGGGGEWWGGRLNICLTGIGEFEPEVSRLSIRMHLLYII